MVKLNKYTARVINFDKDSIRMKFIPAEMKKMKLKWDRFQAIDPPGCLTSAEGSQFSCIDAFKGTRGLLFVFEDDVCFIDQAREIFDLAAKELPDDFDTLHLGGTVCIKQERYSDHLYKLKGGVHSTHAILYSEKARDFIVKNYNYKTHEIGIYDHWLFMEGQRLMNSYIVSPMIAFQSPGYSNVQGGYVDYYLSMRGNEIKNLA